MRLEAINEIVKSFLNTKEQAVQSSTVKPPNVLADLTDTYPTGSFYDNSNTNTLFSGSDDSDTLFKQKEKIMQYRQLAMQPEVTDAVDEIVNEIIFVYDDSTPVKIDINEENDKIVTAIQEKFNKILKLLNIKRNLYNIVRRGYVDGQIVLHAAYGEDAKQGIQSIKMIEPTMLFLDPSTANYKYVDRERSHMYTTDTKNEYSKEEIIREDFGMYDGKVNLGYLEYASKPANLLKTLEDLLVPLRFSRSISRRVFNVDIGELPAKRGSEVMREYQSKFKYKKFYNNATGEVSNQQHITSMVEDYWFANRSGGKGTTVDVLDETGNLGELNDILYFNKKLYKSLKIPSSRIGIDSDSDHSFATDSTETTKEDLKFFMFITRIRRVFTSVFKELLKREVISTGTMSEDEWEEREGSVEISFVNQNTFIEKMKLDTFTAKLDVYSTAQEYQGKLFSIETILKEVFGFTDEKIETEFKRIQKEAKNPLYAKFYGDEEDY